MRQAKHDALKIKKKQNPKTVLHRIELKVLINYTKKEMKVFQESILLTPPGRLYSIAVLLKSINGVRGREDNEDTSCPS